MDYPSILDGELMDVMFRVRTNGRPVAAVPMGRDCATLLCSWKAMNELMKQLSEIGAVCTRCGMVSRSSEMHEGECGPGVGCHGDSDLEMILNLPPTVRMNALTQVIVECEQNFKRRNGDISDDLEDES
jgi:hypothetical protein